jgi:hypothetical protein
VSLVIRVSVNDSPLYWVIAKRTTHTDIAVPDDDMLSTYDVCRIWNDPDKDDSDHRQIVHRYGDGATVLARKMMKGLRDV